MSSFVVKEVRRPDDRPRSTSENGGPSSAEVEAQAAARYLDRYFDTLDNFSLDIMRSLSRARNQSILQFGVLRKLKRTMKSTVTDPKVQFDSVVRLLVEMQGAADVKLREMQDHVLEPLDRRKRELDEYRKAWNLKNGASPCLIIERQVTKRVRRSMRVEATANNSDAGETPENGASTSVSAAPPGAPVSLTATTAPAPTSALKQTRRSLTNSIRGGLHTPLRRKSSLRRQLRAEAEEAAALAAGISVGNGTGRGSESSRRSESREESPDITHTVHVDPNEPTYCLCEQVSFGDMILCDNDLCPIEWFHFQCVALVNKPKGKWFCPRCRGDKPTSMKPRSQFLKELQRYNLEKEEKADRPAK